MTDWRDLITAQPDKLGGEPCVRRHRISVADVLEYLASGHVRRRSLVGFPDLTREDVLACLAYAAAREGEPSNFSVNLVRPNLSGIAGGAPLQWRVMLIGPRRILTLMSMSAQDARSPWHETRHRSDAPPA